jgi:GntR family transcriptional regulator/MocR family aminotransferase
MKTTKPELQVGIDRTLQLPIYLQICERFKTAIADGHLQAGARVPAARGLAMELKVARGTVEMAYRILVDEGYLQVRGAAGTVVSPALPQPVLRQAQIARSKAARSAGSILAAPQDFAIHDGGEPRALQPGLPALDAFPRKVWSRLVAHRLRSADRAAFVYPNPSGYGPLRERIATYLGISRGVQCLPEQVFVTTGYRATLELVLRSHAVPGDRFWFEDPGYLLARRFLTQAGVQLVPVPVDGHGLDVAQGMKIAPDARFALVTPSHQSPLGVTLSLERRIALLEWANDAGSWIVEDDYDSEFRYLGRPLPALKSLDRHDRVIYSGTFSKVMFPGLRLAYVVAPASLSERFRQVCESMNAGAPYLLQAGVTDFISEGHFPRHLRRMRLLYAERRAWIARALEREFGDRLRIDLQPGGLQMIANITDTTDDVVAANRAWAAGLGVHAVSAWYAHKATAAQRGLLLGFANITSPDDAARIARMLRCGIDG